MPDFTHVFLDVYGTLFHEDDLVVTGICRQLAEQSDGRRTTREIAHSWWKAFVPLCSSAIGADFQTQRALARVSLQQTIDHFQLGHPIEPLIEQQYAHWRQPPIFADTRPFLNRLQASGITICLVSNIDDDDLDAAIDFHGLNFPYVVTSERSRAYKPQAAMFEQALALMGAKPETVLHIGDSFSNDVRGAAAVGIPVAWLNRTAKPTPEEGIATYILRDLNESLPILMKPWLHQTALAFIVRQPRSVPMPIYDCRQSGRYSSGSLNSEFRNFAFFVNRIAAEALSARP